MYGYHAHRVNLQRDPIEAACDMLSQNLDEEISLEELARSLQIGYETFRKVFKKQTGVSPARYRTRKKMEQARILLEGGVPMKEIAGLVGYGDVYAFSKQFSRFFWIPTWKVPRTSSHGCAGFRTVLRYRPRFYVSACPG